MAEQAGLAEQLIELVEIKILYLEEVLGAQAPSFSCPEDRKRLQKRLLRLDELFLQRFQEGKRMHGNLVLHLKEKQPEEFKRLQQLVASVEALEDAVSALWANEKI